jgi:hypothetical protein
MGLTVHYKLKFAGPETLTAGRAVVEQLHAAAKRLPFKRVGDIVALSGDECDPDRHDSEGLRWLLIQAGPWVEISGRSMKVRPTRVIAFTAQPGDGSEPMNIGLCLCPKTIEINDAGVKRRARTGASGWSWGSFCKTQYASDPEYGGVQNFLTCHTSVIALLDAAAKIDKVSVEVSDEGDYYENRDLEALAKEVGEWDAMVAAFVGQLKDTLGGAVEAPILTRPDFEHLEAAGLAKLS